MFWDFLPMQKSPLTTFCIPLQLLSGIMRLTAGRDCPIIEIMSLIAISYLFLFQVWDKFHSFLSGTDSFIISGIRDISFDEGTGFRKIVCNYRVSEG